MEKSIKIKHLDQEERDLEEALNDIDVSKLPKPDPGTQNKFKSAAANFVKKETVEFICADGSEGYQKEAPFDKILASASAEKLPQVWKEQLKIGGRIVTPIGSSIWLFIKKSEKEFEEIEYPGFAFVPLITK